MSVTGKTQLTEGNVFIGPHVPPEIKQMIKYLPKTDKSSFRKVIQASVALLEGSDQVSEDTFLSIKNETNLGEEFDIVYAGLHSLLKVALRTPLNSLKQDVFKQDLLEIK
ncbi:COMM domain-containing protein 5 [Nymphon striatum]|nr:COMM domain-containing protein 5 [Nymphon striatum]